MDYEYIEKLVLKSKNGDKLSKEKLVNEFRPLILNIAKRTFLHGYENHDIQNECYKTLFKCLSMYKMDSHRFVAYASNGIRNNINDLIKRVKTRSSAEGSEALTLSDDLEDSLPSNEDNIEEALCSKADYEALKLAIASLSKEERELIKFVFLKNNTLAAYALLKNMPYSTANRRKKIALMKLSKYMNQAPEIIKYSK
ncbi:sigma-70 family RNA polymerase sigma factor [Clostridium sp.]|uniref:sigma-70 family RNA polymerase sigma factor n=1 Tax=Clostridium sp. TaxID=1506 RepID=UPI00284B2D4E|nr:sigma-70 family RNA polymerase sigma factor [Clostridium sp.]MDR3598167.1 sigma-70 family RNA polymerase sigma factor [Clostridium sp.]